MKPLTVERIELCGGGPRDGMPMPRDERLLAEVTFVSGLSVLSPHIHLLDHYRLRRMGNGSPGYQYEGRW